MTTDPELSARDLILALIDSANRESLSARYFVAAGDLFAIDPRSVRVALGRLVKDGSLQQSARGIYQLGSRGGTLHRLVRNWSRVEASVKPWSGRWLAVFVAHLARSNRTSLRGRERALRLFGFAEPTAGLWVRPDNLVIEADALRDGLIELGLEPAAVSCHVSELFPEDVIRPHLWNVAALEDRYRQNISTIESSVQRCKSFTEEEVGRETLQIGRAVTRDILLDPLLPEALVDVALRRQMVEAMRGYDRLGKTFWRNFEARHNTVS